MYLCEGMYMGVCESESACIREGRYVIEGKSILGV